MGIVLRFLEIQLMLSWKSTVSANWCLKALLQRVARLCISNLRAHYLQILPEEFVKTSPPRLSLNSKTLTQETEESEALKPTPSHVSTALLTTFLFMLTPLTESKKWFTKNLPRLELDQVSLETKLSRWYSAFKRARLLSKRRMTSSHQETQITCNLRLSSRRNLTMVETNSGAKFPSLSVLHKPRARLKPTRRISKTTKSFIPRKMAHPKTSRKLSKRSQKMKLWKVVPPSPLKQTRKRLWDKCSRIESRSSTRRWRLAWYWAISLITEIPRICPSTLRRFTKTWKVKRPCGWSTQNTCKRSRLRSKILQEHFWSNGSSMSTASSDSYQRLST